jgi:hypothetical protein
VASNTSAHSKVVEAKLVCNRPLLPLWTRFFGANLATINRAFKRPRTSLVKDLCVHPGYWSPDWPSWLLLLLLLCIHILDQVPLRTLSTLPSLTTLITHLPPFTLHDYHLPLPTYTSFNTHLSRQEAARAAEAAAAALIIRLDLLLHLLATSSTSHTILRLPRLV